MSPSSPVIHEKGSHWSTLVRAKVRAGRYDQYMTYEVIADPRKMPLSTIYDIYSDTSSHRYHDNPKNDEDRGRSRKITPADIRYMELSLEEDGFKAWQLTWDGQVKAETEEANSGSHLLRPCTAHLLRLPLLPWCSL